MPTPRLLAPILALSLALPAAAQADPQPQGQRGRDLAFMLGAAAIIALAARDHDRREDEEEAREARDEAASRRLPAACLRTFEPLAGGAVRLHDPDCLDAHVARAAELPLACAVTLRTDTGFASGFDPDCLGREGWPTEGRRAEG